MAFAMAPARGKLQGAAIAWCRETVLRLEPQGAVPPARGAWPEPSCSAPTATASTQGFSISQGRDEAVLGVSITSVPSQPSCVEQHLWARLQGAELLLGAGWMCQWVWEASSHCSGPAPQGIGVPGTVRDPRAHIWPAWGRGRVSWRFCSS